MTSPNDDDAITVHLNTLFTLLAEQNNDTYIGESISQLDHSLQATHFAALDASPPSTIIAALLHDIGQFIPLSSARDILVDGASVGRHAHDALGAAYLRAHGWPAAVHELVAAHVAAKRYLATDPSYRKALSTASEASLKAQGGPFTDEEKRTFEQDPLWREKVRLRKYDDRSKVVGMQVVGLEGYRGMAEDVLRGSK
ncbi:conserved hypothetical protein [Sporisorium reilianum SRZ2]|uniref:HD domain-containing protein n=1 Tax=Sporisorium reilianum (strain SRZ2) TaxID=999809 RepID=E7A140_SPORE|nr:conserved hypothetical protein [Sporisorium reilianum SRZ2]